MYPYMYPQLGCNVFYNNYNSHCFTYKATDIANVLKFIYGYLLLKYNFQRKKEKDTEVNYFERNLHCK